MLTDVVMNTVREDRRRDAQRVRELTADLADDRPLTLAQLAVGNGAIQRLGIDRAVIDAAERDLRRGSAALLDEVLAGFEA